MNDRDIDAQFDAIVARWHDGEDPTPPRPRTVQDITTAYAALSRPEADAPPAPDEPTSEDPAATDTVATPSALPPLPPARRPEGTTPHRPLDDAVADPSLEEPGTWRSSSGSEDVEEHFEPAPVQLPPGEDIGYWGTLVGLVGGPLLLLWVALASPFHAGWWVSGGIALFLGGFALLVMRQPRDRDPHGDDGARV